MSARLEVQLQDLDASSALRKLAEACEDLRKPLESIGGHLRTSTNLRFLNQVDPDGQPWKPSKRARKLGGKTLIDRGQLRDSFNAQLVAGGLEFGTDLVNAAAHQFGVDKVVTVGAHVRKVSRAFGRQLPVPVISNVRSHQRKMFMPVRRMIGWTDTDDEVARETFTNHLAQVL